MRALITAFCLLSSGGLAWELRQLALERDALVRERAELDERARREGEHAERARALDLLVERARDLPGGALGIAAMRDLLIGAERGLAIDRISLDFRPESSLPQGRSGGSIQANLSGTFDAVYDYLERVEMLRLPLVAFELSLRRDAGERLLLSVRYRALWELGGRDSEVLTSSDVARLTAWLSHPGRPTPERNPFAPGGSRDVELSASENPPTVHHSPPAEGQAVAPIAPELPRLVGYVLARPELEPDVSRRVLAAVRFEGELRLLKTGDVFGPFHVERIEARESVLLVDQRTKQRLKLHLE